MNVSDNIKQFKGALLKKSNIFFVFLILLIFFLDRISKIKVLKDFNESTYYVSDVLNIELIWNTGIGFGLFSTQAPILYNLITLLIGIVIIALYYVLIISEKIDKLIYSIIIGGALGNFYDRLIFKAVPDYIDLHYNNFHWFAFNVADIFITIGIITFIIRSFFVKD